jgi:hypothetical protein
LKDASAVKYSISLGVASKSRELNEVGNKSRNLTFATSL